MLRGSAGDSAEELDDLARGHEVVLAAGISLGAHALVAAWAGADRTAPLVLVMPAWTGAPGQVAGATAAAADDLALRGRDAVLASLATDPRTRDDWVREELAAAWSAYDDGTLVAALRAASTSPGPTSDQLARVRSPTALVALADDPLHPEAVAREWALTIPRAVLRVVARRAPDHARDALGTAAAEALEELLGVSGSR